MRDLMVGERVVDLGAQCDGVCLEEGTVVAVDVCTGCAKVEDDCGFHRCVPIHDLRPVDGSRGAGLLCPLDGYPRYT